MTRGRFDPKEVASIANNSTWEFCPLKICVKVKLLKQDWACLTLSRYSCIRGSLASNFPLTCLTTKLESNYTSTTFPPSLITIVIPTNKASYSVSLFVANYRDFSNTSFLGETSTILSPKPFWFATPSVYTSQAIGEGIETPKTPVSNSLSPHNILSKFGHEVC